MPNVFYLPHGDRISTNKLDSGATHQGKCIPSDRKTEYQKVAVRLYSVHLQLPFFNELKTEPIFQKTEIKIRRVYMYKHLFNNCFGAITWTPKPSGPYGTLKVNNSNKTDKKIEPTLEALAI